MKIEKIRNDALILRTHLGKAVLPDGTVILVSFSGSSLIIEMGKEMYGITIESIVKDIIELHKKEEQQ